MLSLNVHPISRTNSQILKVVCSPHELPNETKDKRLPSIDDICPLNSYHVHLVCFRQLYCIVCVLYCFETRDADEWWWCVFIIIFRK